MIPLLWRRSALVRLVLAVVALALGGGAVLATQLAGSALQRQAREAVQESAGRAQYDITPFNQAGFSADEAAAVARLPAVAEVGLLRRKADLAQTPSGADRQVVLVVVGESGVALRPLPLVAGAVPADGSLDTVAVSQALSPGFSGATGEEASGSVGLGQRLSLTEARRVGSFRVVGLVADYGSGAPFTDDAVYVTPAAATKLFPSGLQIADLAVRLRPGSGEARLMAELPSVLSTDYTVSDPRLLPNDDPLAELQPLLDGITALSMLLAFALIAATFSAVVLERRREIGLVRLAGSSRTLVFRSFFREALAAAGLGALLGVGVGYLLAWALVRLSSPSGQPPVTVAMNWGWALISFLVALVVGMLAAAAPALEAATVSPLEAVSPPLRRSVRASRRWPVVSLLAALAAAFCFARGGALGTVAGAILAYLAVCAALAWVGPTLVTGLGSYLGALLAAPVAAVSARSRSRPGRTTLALGSLFVTVATATALAGLAASALDSGSVWVDHVFVGNYLVVSPTPQTDAVGSQLLAAVATAPGHPKVSASAPARFVSARVGHVAISLVATSPEAYLRTGALQFVNGSRGSGLRAMSRGDGVLIPIQMAATLDLHLGSAVKVVTGSGSERLTVAGVVAHTLPGPAGSESMLISAAAAVRHFGAQASGFDLVQLAVAGPGAARAVRLAAFRYGMEAEAVASVRAGVKQGLEHDIAALGALSLAGVVVALLAAINTVVLETREASSDLALLRAIGLGRSALGRAVLGEAAATALVGGGLGLLGGVGLIWPEVRAASTPALPLPFAVAPEALLAALLAVVAALALAAALPARQLSEIDPLAALALE